MGGEGGGLGLGRHQGRARFAPPKGQIEARRGCAKAPGEPSVQRQQGNGLGCGLTSRSSQRAHRRCKPGSTQQSLKARPPPRPNGGQWKQPSSVSPAANLQAAAARVVPGPLVAPTCRRNHVSRYPTTTRYRSRQSPPFKHQRQHSAAHPSPRSFPENLYSVGSSVLFSCTSSYGVLRTRHPSLQRAAEASTMPGCEWTSCRKRGAGEIAMASSIPLPRSPRLARAAPPGGLSTCPKLRILSQTVDETRASHRTACTSTRTAMRCGYHVSPDRQG